MDQSLLTQFEAGAERRGSGCLKWDGCEAVFGRADVLPLWIADMDFRCPDPIAEALAQSARSGVFGYPIRDFDAETMLCGWMERRHGLRADPKWILYSPGVVSSLLHALRALTKPGDLVAVQPPVYGPFYQMAERAGVALYRNPLRRTNSGWRMDLDHLEQGFKKGARCLMLCSPHNPVGRIWTRQELADLTALCARYDAGIVSDEIHMDFEMPGHTHTPILRVEGGERSILLTSASKTFNLAGLRHSSLIVSDPSLRKKVSEILADAAVDEPNHFGRLAQSVAYREGGAWLDGLIEYLDGNRRFLRDALRGGLPEIIPAALEGTYLMWLDMRALRLSQPDLMRLLVHKAGIAPSDGLSFGEEGDGFVRVNIATPRRHLQEALERLERAVRSR